MQDGTDTTRKCCIRNTEKPVPSSNYGSPLALTLHSRMYTAMSQEFGDDKWPSCIDWM